MTARNVACNTTTSGDQALCLTAAFVPNSSPLRQATPIAGGTDLPSSPLKLNQSRFSEPPNGCTMQTVVGCLTQQTYATHAKQTHAHRHDLHTHVRIKRTVLLRSETHPSRVPMSIAPASTRPRLCRSKRVKNKIHENSRLRSVGAIRQAERSHSPVCRRAGTLAAKWHPHHRGTLAT